MKKILVTLILNLFICGIVYSQSCKVFFNNDTIPSIGGVSGRCIIMKRSLLLKCDSIVLNQPNLKVCSFKASFGTSGMSNEYSSKSNLFSIEMKTSFKNTNTFYVIIESIKIVNKNGIVSKPTFDEIRINIID